MSKEGQIIVSDDYVEMTITYRETYSTDQEMIEAVNGAKELKGLCSLKKEGQIEGEV